MMDFQPILKCCVMFAGRTADMVTTWKVSPNLSAELNPIVRSMGWRGWLFMNGLLVGGAPCLPWAVVWIFAGVSTAAALVNLAVLYIRRRRR